MSPPFKTSPQQVRHTADEVSSEHAATWRKDSAAMIKLARRQGHTRSTTDGTFIFPSNPDRVFNEAADSRAKCGKWLALLLCGSLRRHSDRRSENACGCVMLRSRLGVRNPRPALMLQRAPTGPCHHFHMPHGWSRLRAAAATQYPASAGTGAPRRCPPPPRAGHSN